METREIFLETLQTTEVLLKYHLTRGVCTYHFMAVKAILDSGYLLQHMVSVLLLEKCSNLGLGIHSPDEDVGFQIL